MNESLDKTPQLKPQLPYLRYSGLTTLVHELWAENGKYLLDHPNFFGWSFCCFDRSCTINKLSQWYQQYAEHCLTSGTKDMHTIHQSVHLLIPLNFCIQAIPTSFISCIVYRRAIVYLCKYFPHSRAFSLMRADYCVYIWAGIAPQTHSRSVVSSACAFLAYTGAHQVENIYKE